MLEILLFAAAAAQTPETSPGPTGAVSVSILEGSGAMVADLRADEVTVKEEGQARVVKRVERDARPLAVAVLVDSSDVMGQGFLRELADPVMDFLDAMPAGIHRTLLTIGTPPEAMSLEDPAATRATLRAKATFGKLELYDGIAEGCTHLLRHKGTRRALVLVISDRFSETDRQKALDTAARTSPLVLAVQFHGDGSYAPGLDSIVKWSGGRYEQIGSATGVGKVLKKLLPELDPPWLVIYDTPSGAEKRKVEVKVARKGTKVRVRPAGLD